jgi:hypothetical protein
MNTQKGKFGNDPCLLEKASSVVDAIISSFLIFFVPAMEMNSNDFANSSIGLQPPSTSPWIGLAGNRASLPNICFSLINVIKLGAPLYRHVGFGPDQLVQKWPLIRE